jgi:hypothetical protein
MRYREMPADVFRDKINIRVDHLTRPAPIQAGWLWQYDQRELQRDPMSKPPFLRGLGVLLTAGFFSTGCKEAPLPPAPEPPVVTVAEPIEQAVTEHVDFSGKTGAVGSHVKKSAVEEPAAVLSNQWEIYT